MDMQQKLQRQQRKIQKRLKWNKLKAGHSINLFSHYLDKHAAEEAAFIEKQFDLETDVATLDPAAVNKAFVRGFSKIALDEYTESLEAMGRR